MPCYNRACRGVLGSGAHLQYTEKTTPPILQRTSTTLTEKTTTPIFQTTSTPATMPNKLEFSPATPIPLVYDVQARIKTLKGFLDPNNPRYQKNSM